MDTLNQEASLIRKEQVYLQYSLFKTNALGGVFAAAMLSLLLWNYISHYIILIWFVFICAMIAVRLYFYFTLLRVQPHIGNITAWETKHTVISTIIGSTWGSAGIFLFPAQDIEHQAILIIILLGVAATAGMTLSVLRKQAYIYTLLTITPMTLHLALEMTQTGLSLALLSIAFTWLLLKNIDTSYRTYLDNITLRIQAGQRENQLKKFHGAFEHAKDAIMIFDLDAKLEYVNPAFETMTGYSGQEAVGQFIKILRSGKHPPSFYAQLEAQDKSGKPWQGEITIKCKDGSFLDVERTVSPIFDDQGKATFLVAIQRDLTEHKRLEDQFLQAQKMEAIGTLVGGIAHDFNNILASISGNTFLLKTKLSPQHEAQERLKRIDQSAERAASLVQQMLTFARKDTVRMAALDLSQLTEEVFTLLRSSIPENIILQKEAEKRFICIEGDTAQIHQILLNLVNNARDAVATVQQPKISLQLDIFYANKAFHQQNPHFEHDAYAHLCVQDNGSGIPQDNIEHLFEPFFTTKDVGKGTGLGLSMVFGAVKRHKGLIEIDSQEGEGTSVHIYLPLLKIKTERESTPPSTHIPIQGHHELILLVDDEPLILEMGTDVLKALGYRVVQALDGLEAIDVFKANQQSIALIISDIVMPRLGGVDCITRIRKINPSIPVIFATGYDRSSSSTEEILKNGDDVIGKPYTIEDLSMLMAKKLHQT